MDDDDISFDERKKRRLSTGLVLKEQSRGAFTADLDENDDEAEKEQLRKEKEARRKTVVGGVLSDKSNATGSSGASGHKPQGNKATPAPSMGNSAQQPQAALPPAQLVELYSKCVQLLSANKINMQNSWQLSLIDSLEDVVQQDLDVPDMPGDDENGSGPSAGAGAGSSSGPGGMNFQKASCALDASVKIYSYRVDSVHKATYKVLGGLNRSDDRHPGAGGAGGDDDDNNSGSDDDGQDGDGAGAAGDGAVKLGPDGEPIPDAGKKKQKREKVKRAHVVTLESNPDALNVKKLELEFEVDPLFRKTSALFDEGGAKGLLLNNLSVYNYCDLVFDSCESLLEPSSTSPPQDTDANAQAQFVDGSELKSLLAALSTAAGAGGDIMSMNVPLCPPLGDMLRLCSQLQQGDLSGVKKKSDNASSEEDNKGDSQLADGMDQKHNDSNNTGLNDDSDHDDGGFAGGDGMDMADQMDLDFVDRHDGAGERHSAGDESFPMEADDVPSGGAARAASGAVTAAAAAGGGVGHNRRMTMGSGGILVTGSDAGSMVPLPMVLSTEQSDFLYFDPKMIPGQSMAAHWKRAQPDAKRKTGKAGELPESSGKSGRSKNAGVDADDGDDAADDEDYEDANGKSKSKPKGRKKKEKFWVDFFSQEAVPEVLLAKPTRATTVQSELQLNKADASLLLLPDDMFFSSKTLQTLFTRPNMLLRLRSSTAAAAAAGRNTDPDTADGATSAAGSSTLVVIAPAEPSFGPVNGLAGSGDHGYDNDGMDMDDHGDDGDDGGMDRGMALASSIHDNMSAGAGMNEFDVFMPGGADGNGMELVAKPQRVDKIDIQYATFAKKVDVRALKQSLWSNLKLPPAEPASAASKEKAVSAKQQPPEEPKPVRSFQDTIASLHGALPEDQMESISVPYCFICLLHLCNENNLTLSYGAATEAPQGKPKPAVAGSAVDTPETDAQLHFGDFNIFRSN